MRFFTYSPSTPNAVITNPTKMPLPASAYRNPRVHLMHLQCTSLPHQPDIDEGRARYQAQVEDWHQKHGTYPQAKPNEYRPHPLTPGTQPISLGACFNCGGKRG